MGAGKIVSIHSYRGCTGKTQVTANVAACALAMGKRVAVLDADHGENILKEREEIESPCDPAEYRAIKRIVSKPDNFIAVGCGGGSVHGLAANCAFIEILDELELRQYVREIWGTSAGSIVGCGWSMGLSGREILEFVMNMADKKAIDVPVGRMLLRDLPNLIFKGRLPDGLVRGKVFADTIMAGMRVQTFEETEIPFRAITCTDDGYARKVILRSGSLINAIRASMCLPGLFDPVEDWNGEPYGYFDGGIVEKTPLISVIEEHNGLARSDQLVVLCTHLDSAARVTRPEGFLDRFLSVIDHLEEGLWSQQLVEARQAPNCKFFVLNPKIPIGEMLDFHLAQAMYLWSRKTFKRQLSNAGLAMRFDTGTYGDAAGNW